MERLSERCGDYIRIKGCSALYANEERKGAYLNNAVVRFADYEDTGMEPEQITAAQKAMRAGLALACALQAYRALGTVEELSALVKARDEGRLTVQPPPAIEGDPKPACFYDNGASLWCLGLSREGDDEPVDRCKRCWYCESGDYAEDRAEAEAALGGGKRG